MCLMVNYNILGDELESSGDELVSSDGEQYVLYGRFRYAGWRASKKC